MPELRMLKPVCHLGGGARGRGGHHGSNMGVYPNPTSSGEVRVGDALTSAY
jgi:hypothetical protein